MEEPRGPQLFADYEASPAERPPAEDLWIRPATPQDREAIARLVAERMGLPLAEVMARSRDSSAVEATTWVAGFEREAALVQAFARVARFEPAPDAPGRVAPPGEYLSGVIVAPGARRRGLARALTAARLASIDARGGEAFYFCNARNRASIDLHAPFGFVELTREFWFPGVTFVGGEGILFHRPRGSSALVAREGHR